MVFNKFGSFISYYMGKLNDQSYYLQVMIVPIKYIMCIITWNLRDVIENNLGNKF